MHSSPCFNCQSFSEGRLSLLVKLLSEESLGILVQCAFSCLSGWASSEAPVTVLFHRISCLLTEFLVILKEAMSLRKPVDWKRESGWRLSYSPCNVRSEISLARVWAMVGHQIGDRLFCGPLIAPIMSASYFSFYSKNMVNKEANNAFPERKE